MIKKIKLNLKNKKEKIKLFDYSDDISVVGDTGVYSNIIMTGNKALRVEGCKSIVEYTPTFIKLNLGKGYISINGAALKITMLDSQEVKVCGEIISVEFC